MRANISNQHQGGSLRPAKYDKDGPLFAVKDVHILAANMMTTNLWEKGKAKQMTSEFNKASEILDEAHNVFAAKLHDFSELERRFAETSKKAVGSVRDSTQKLADGLARLEKTANFDRLERITVLLERAEKALSSLAELERAGRLEKISSALK